MRHLCLCPCVHVRCHCQVGCLLKPLAILAAAHTEAHQQVSRGADVWNAGSEASSTAIG